MVLNCPFLAENRRNWPELVLSWYETVLLETQIAGNGPKLPVMARDDANLPILDSKQAKMAVIEPKWPFPGILMAPKWSKTARNGP